MNMSMISNLARPTRVWYFAATLALAVMVAPAGAQPPLAAANFRSTQDGPTQNEDMAPQWLQSGVHHLIGLPGVKQRAVGKLWVAHNGIGFESEGKTVLVEATKILNLSTGDERVMKGGVFGRVARTGIPAGGGLATGLVGVGQAFSLIPPAVGLAASIATQGGVDIVTIEFLDPHDGYHGAVFTMPRHAAEGLATNVLLTQATANADPPQDSCPSVSARPTSISLHPILSADKDLPAEYRVLVYERLFSRLRATQSQLPVYRPNNPNNHAGCDPWKLTITVETFRKGDAVKRALLGPAGMFVGTTSLDYRVTVSDSGGASMLDERMRAVIRGDNESLDLSEKISKSINGKIGNLQAKAAPAGH